MLEKINFSDVIIMVIRYVRLLFEGGFYCNLGASRCGFYLRAACNKVRLLITSLRYVCNYISERPIRPKLKSADTDYRPKLPIKSAD